MKLSSTFTRHFVLGAIFGAAALFGFGVQKANGQTYQDRYYDGYYGNSGYYGQDRHHRKHEKRDLKDHQRHEREYYGNSRALRQHQRQEKRQMKRHQRNERRYYRDDYYPYNY